MHVKSVSVFDVPGSSKLKGRANIVLESEGKEITLKGFRVYDDGLKDPWVGVTQEKYIKDGQPEYKETLWLNEKLMSEVSQKTIEEYKKNKSRKG